MSTFYKDPSSKEPITRVGMTHYPKVTTLLKPLFREYQIEIVHRNDTSLKNALGSIKDIPPDLHKSGIYRIQCRTCGRFYFGMSIRKLFIRFNDYAKSARWKRKTA